MKKTAVLAATVAIAALTAPALGSGKSVRVLDYRFSAKTIHVQRGTTVTWKWGGSDDHNVTFRHFHSPTKSSGSYRHRFTRAGTYSYRCTIHAESGMVGRVVVG